MAGRFALISLAAFLCCCRLVAVWGADPPQAAEQLVMLRNGEILRGRVTREGDHYNVSIADGELRFRTGDVDLICHTLDEAYQARRARLTVGRAEDHLDLADWCLRQGLPAEAARELSSAIVLDPANPRIGLVDRRLKESLAPPPAPSRSKSAVAPRITDEDLDRMLRALPPAAIESFTTSIQPLLISSCATAGCHGSTNKASAMYYSLIRVPADRFASRRLTQRNLQATLSWLDFQNPQQSRLLAVVDRPHGTINSAVFDPQGTKYRELLIWIGMVTQKPVTLPEVVSQPPTIRPANVNPAWPRGRKFNSGGSAAAGAGDAFPSDEIPATAAADTDTRPVRQTHRVAPSRPALPRQGSTASEKDGAMLAGRQPGAEKLPQAPFGHPAKSPPFFPPPAVAPRVPSVDETKPAAGSDPYDAEAFNRQFAGKMPGSPPAAPSAKPVGN